MPCEVSEETILKELEEFSCSVTDESVLSKMKELCFVYQLDAVQMVSNWVAFATTKNIDSEVTVDLLNQLEREELNKKVKTPKSSRRSQKTQHVYNATTIDLINSSIDDDLLEGYGTPTGRPSLQGQKRIRTPENAVIKRLNTDGRSPGLPFSPASISPGGVTPSTKYGNRTTSGDVVSFFGNEGDFVWKSSKQQRCAIKYYDEENSLKEKYSYMFEKLRERASVLNNCIEDMAAFLQKKHKIEEWSHIRLPMPEEINVVGRVVCDGNGKLNSSSLLLEGSRETCSGQTVQLDVNNLKEYSFFPGQILAARGINNQGMKLVLKHLYQNVLLPFPECCDSQSEMSEPLQLVVAAGPFTTSDTLSYEPLHDLIHYIKEHKPHACILIGPFVDAKHEEIEKGSMNETYENFFEQQVESIALSLEGSGTQLILVPSIRDIHHELIYPTPPFTLKKKFENIHCVPDPSLLNIDGVVIAVTSTDILFHLGKEEISFRPGTSDRLGRLAQHILSQHCFYPLYPPTEEMCIDYENFELFAKLPVTPHILILPSDLRNFIKNVDGCCCINPERLTKGLVGGNFARIQVATLNPTESRSSIISSIKAEIVKI
ncbi:DNA polymerase alpha subunit B isoform X2 [Tachypleus tridentatus]|uniref:DNA polymerase alpha subunit B isoform X2 n=1 Tax=Tachypleus tridentatus TaxID=6853 RepID=UPI003FD564FC